MDKQIATYSDNKWCLNTDENFSFAPSIHIIKNILDTVSHIDLIEKSIIKSISGKDLLGIL